MVQVESSWLGSRFPSATASPFPFTMKDESSWKPPLYVEGGSQ